MEDLKAVFYLGLSIVIYLIIKRDERFYVASKQERCKNCGEKIDIKDLYCPNCNEQVKKVCDNCGKLIDIDWRYCPFCENVNKIAEINKIIGGNYNGE